MEEGVLAKGEASNDSLYSFFDDPEEQSLKINSAKKKGNFEVHTNNEDKERGLCDFSAEESGPVSKFTEKIAKAEESNDSVHVRKEDVSKGRRCHVEDTIMSLAAASQQSTPLIIHELHSGNQSPVDMSYNAGSTNRRRQRTRNIIGDTWHMEGNVYNPLNREIIILDPDGNEVPFDEQREYYQDQEHEQVQDVQEQEIVEIEESEIMQNQKESVLSVCHQENLSEAENSEVTQTDEIIPGISRNNSSKHEFEKGFPKTVQEEEEEGNYEGGEQESATDEEEEEGEACNQRNEEGTVSRVQGSSTEMTNRIKSATKAETFYETECNEESVETEESTNGDRDEASGSVSRARSDVTEVIRIESKSSEESDDGKNCKDPDESDYGIIEDEGSEGTLGHVSIIESSSESSHRLILPKINTSGPVQLTGGVLIEESCTSINDYDRKSWSLTDKAYDVAKRLRRQQQIQQQQLQQQYQQQLQQQYDILRIEHPPAEQVRPLPNLSKSGVPIPLRADALLCRNGKLEISVTDPRNLLPNSGNVDVNVTFVHKDVVRPEYYKTRTQEKENKSSSSKECEENQTGP
ncbi:hypothetical protein FSP39_014417 [Pinctada imbricata]|uniref:Uncharacterized protein n=1 Tax=Pinctada imbricata TaxID=66713 RepID=A0AA88Y9B4_PINIB|nr:hypothetical protein FSP39_014417 [Pinctada imbricata]